jgi:hypothetical protein
MGTVYLPDTALFNPERFRFSGRMRVPGLTGWAVDRLVVSNATPRFPDPGFVLTVTNDLLITGSGKLELGGDQTLTNQFAGPGAFVYSGSTGPVLQVGGGLILTNGGSLVVYAGLTNSTMGGYGARVSVTGEVVIGTNCWIYPHSQPTNGGSVCFRMDSLTIPFTNGGFNADGRGYVKGFKTGRITGSGPGGGEQDSGGSYGGRGASYFPTYRTGWTYGSPSNTAMPGSGGGGENSAAVGTDGGGAIWIEAAGHVLANGILSANALEATMSSGSGGGIFIACRTIGGTGGVIRANGGRTVNLLCPGGGGRIAVHYDTALQQALPKPRILFSAARGTHGDPKYPNDDGTVYFTDTTLLDEAWMPHTGQFYPMTNWAVASLTVSNTAIRFPANGFAMSVSGTLQVTGPTGSFGIGGDAYTTNKFAGEEFILSAGAGPTLNVNGSVVLTNGGRLAVYAGLTNAPETAGAKVTVKGDVWVHSSSWIHPHSNPTNGGSVWFDLANLYCMTNAGIDADYRGYRRGLDKETKGFGPGGARGNDSGGGYGGTGGWYSVSSRAGLTYGDSNAPAYPGSGGRGEETGIIGGNGGGLIRIKASGTVLVKGKLTARGANPRVSTYGGGSGGGIYVICKTFAGEATGSLNANGGNGPQTAGGGGRIAVYRVRDTSGGAVTATVAPGIGTNSPLTEVAYPGTIVWRWLKGAGTVLAVY